MTALLAEHKRSGALVTMTVVAPEPGAHGGVRVESDGVVTGFTKRGSPEPSYHFVGVQAVEARAFASITPGVPAESVLELYPALIAAQHGSVRRLRAGRNSSISARRLITCAHRCFCLHGRTAKPRSGHDRESTRAHTSKIDSVGRCGSGSARCSASASSRTACASSGASWVGATLRCADEALPGETLIDGVAIGPISPV